MLVLSRKIDQKIQIGPDITVTILRMKRNSVQIGVEAPDGIRIFRSELLETTASCGETQEDREAPETGETDATEDQLGDRFTLRPARPAVVRRARRGRTDRGGRSPRLRADPGPGRPGERRSRCPIGADRR